MDRHPTDTQVQLNVHAQLDWEPALSAAQIDVQVHDGVVALSGQVHSCQERWAAERAAQRVPGVRCVTSEIGVALSKSSRRSDADIARSAQNMLRWITLLPTGCVKAVVAGGWITLSGSVHWDYQRQAAAAAVRHVVGVAGVTDLVTLGIGRPPLASVQTHQETA